VTFSGVALEWEVLARVLGLAAAAGLHLPALLVMPWILTLLPGTTLTVSGGLGGLDSPAPAVLGLVMLAGWLLVRRLPLAGTAYALLLAGAGVMTAALLPWLLSTVSGGGIRILECLAAVVVSVSVAGVRMGWTFIHAHPPVTLPGSEAIRRRAWPIPAIAGALVVGTVVAPAVSGLAALGLLSLALGPGRGALRASGFALRLLTRSLAGGRRVPIPEWALEGAEPEPIEPMERASPERASPRELRGTPAALLGEGGGGLRPGWLIGGLQAEGHLCFRYRTPLGAWDLDLSGAEAERIEAGPLGQVRSITRGGVQYMLLVPPGLAAGATGRTDTVRRNL
jgi:hypothetical protein